MSQAVSGIAGALIAAASDELNILFKTKRAIGPGPLLPDCAIEEEHSDTLTVTRHPVQQGANITDHAYKEPATLRLRWSWSNSAPGNNLGGGFLGSLAKSFVGFGGSEDYVLQVYAKLLNMQVSGAPVQVSTGKRLYNNMMITGLAIKTNNDSEYALPMEIELTEVIFVNTQTAQTPSQDQMSQPQQTAPVETQGTQQPAATTPSPSILSSLGAVFT